MSLPKDPYILLSVVNTRLRDFYESLEELCDAEDTEPAALTRKLSTIGYHYSEPVNQFIQ